MLERRKIIGGGLVAGLVGAVMPSDAAADATGIARAAASTDENTPILKQILEELQAQRATCGTGYCPQIGVIRRAQYVFLKAHGRYPEYIDVGVGPWEEVYDWHVKYQVPIKVGRMTDGSYSVPFLLTTLILRPSMSDTYVGPGYDGR